MSATADVFRPDEIQTMSRSDDWRSVYDFWFPLGLDTADLETHYRMLERWFRGGVNAELPPFAPLVDAAAAGDLNHWLARPLGRLSLIVVLDQFPRGLFAGTPKAFAFDLQAVAITTEGLRIGHYDALLHSWEKAFSRSHSSMPKGRIT